MMQDYRKMEINKQYKKTKAKKTKGKKIKKK